MAPLVSSAVSWWISSPLWILFGVTSATFCRNRRVSLLLQVAAGIGGALAVAAAMYALFALAPPDTTAGIRKIVAWAEVALLGFLAVIWPNGRAHRNR